MTEKVWETTIPIGDDTEITVTIEDGRRIMRVWCPLGAEFPQSTTELSDGEATAVSSAVLHGLGASLLLFSGPNGMSRAYTPIQYPPSALQVRAIEQEAGGACVGIFPLMGNFPAEWMAEAEATHEGGEA